MRNLRFWAPLLALLLALPAGRALTAGELETESSGSAELFDGTGRYAGTAAQAGASAEGKAQLLAALKSKVAVNGTPEQTAALNSLLARVLDSPTGRELAVQFVREDARASLSFEDIPGTQVSEINGRRTFSASGGHAHTTYNPPTVHLNSAYQQARQEDAPGTLAHELFGHVMERKRSERYGVQDSYIYHQNEEANAGLIGWTVHAELGNKLDNGWAWIYMANPADYHRRLKTNMAYYAGTLSTEEMQDPLSAYQARLRSAEGLLLRLPVKKEQNENWLKIIDHLVEAHRRAAEAFRTLKEKINAAIAGVASDEIRLKDIQTYLKQLIARCTGNTGAAWQRQLERDSENAYFAEQRRVMEEREKVLAGLMLGRTYDNEQPPERPGQVTWPQLEEMWKQDQDSSCGWRV